MVKKYGRRSRSGWEDMFREVKDFKGNPRIFGDKEEVRGEEEEEEEKIPHMSESIGHRPLQKIFHLSSL